MQPEKSTFPLSENHTFPNPTRKLREEVKFSNWDLFLGSRAVPMTIESSARAFFILASLFVMEIRDCWEVTCSQVGFVIPQGEKKGNTSAPNSRHKRNSHGKGLKQ